MPNKIVSRTLTTSGPGSASSVLDMSAANNATRTVITLAAHVTGTANYTIQYSYNRTPPNTPWFDVSGMTGNTGNADTQMDRQIQAIQLVQNSGDGSVVLYYITEFQS